MNGFPKDGRMILGINYWASGNAINMWSGWDPRAVEEDFKVMKDAGIECLRVFPLWPVFQPLSAIRSHDGVIEYRFGEEPLPGTEAGRAGVSEDACRKFEELCRLADRYGLKLMVALITGWMSGRYYAPPAFEGCNPLTDDTAVKWEVRFVRYFVSRFKGEKCILGWDLGNEVRVFADQARPDSAYVWTALIANTVRACDPERPVISGLDTVPLAKGEFNIRDIGEAVDAHTIHPYNIFHTPGDPIVSMRPVFWSAHMCRLYEDVGKAPTFVQEIGSIGYTNCSEQTEAEFYRAVLFSCLAHGVPGVMWWCAFDQGTMEYMPYDGNNLGSDYGFFRIDRSEKPLAKVNREFREFLKSLPFGSLPAAESEAVCLVPLFTGSEAFGTLLSAHCLAEQAGISLSFAYAGDGIPDSPLYLLPSVEGYGQTISFHKLKEILEKVKRGASLYISLGSGLFRNTPEYSGMTLAYKEAMTRPEKVRIGGTVLEILSDYRYTVEECRAEVLASGEDGRPVFVRNRYGEGHIYFSTVAPEKYLAARGDVFSDAHAPDYSLWYRALKGERDGRVVRTDLPIVCVTEHAAADDTRYAVVINYSRDPVSAKLRIRDGWEIDEVFYGAVRDGAAVLDRCGAAVFRLRRRNG